MIPRRGTHRNAALIRQLEQSPPAVLRGRATPRQPCENRSNPMRTEQSVPIRLEDYRPPDWLVETVDLDVSLDPTATRVRAALRLKPNPKATAPAPVVLDGDGLN